MLFFSNDVFGEGLRLIRSKVTKKKTKGQASGETMYTGFENDVCNLLEKSYIFLQKIIYIFGKNVCYLFSGQNRSVCVGAFPVMEKEGCVNLRQKVLPQVNLPLFILKLQ